MFNPAFHAAILNKPLIDTHKPQRENYLGTNGERSDADN